MVHVEFSKNNEISTSLGATILSQKHSSECLHNGLDSSKSFKNFLEGFGAVPKHWQMLIENGSFKL